MPDIYHPVLNKFISYDNEQLDYLKKGGRILYVTGATAYRLYLTEQGNSLFVQSISHIPIEIEEEIPELEADEPDPYVVKHEDDGWDNWDD